MIFQSPLLSSEGVAVTRGCPRSLDASQWAILVLMFGPCFANRFSLDNDSESSLRARKTGVFGTYASQDSYLNS